MHGSVLLTFSSYGVWDAWAGVLANSVTAWLVCAVMHGIAGLYGDRKVEQWPEHGWREALSSW